MNKLSKSIRVYWDSNWSNYKTFFRMQYNAGEQTVLTFDTGASSTVLGFNILVNEGIIKTSKVSDLYTFFTVMGIKPRLFYSATRTKMPAYPCVIKDVDLSGVHIDKFYFYLFLGSDNLDVSLLGNDFIRFCELKKGKSSDIEIVDFDFENYEKSFIATCNNDAPCPINAVYDEIERIESTKNLAASFQYLLKHHT